MTEGRFRILMIGEKGQLARSLAASVLPPGIALFAVGRPRIDLTDPASILETVTRVAPDVIVNVAAYTAVDKAESEPDLAFAINAAGAEHIASQCSRVGVPLIHVSTDYVFDGNKPSPYLETDPVAPLGVYGRSKLEGERCVAAMCPRHIILRTAWVHSPYGQNFIKTMLSLAERRSELAVVDDQIGSPTHAPHLADAILTIVQHLRDGGVAPWGVYHATGEGEVTWCGLAREAFAVAARMHGPSANVRAISTAEYPTTARRPANSRLDCTKLKRAFGIRLPHWRDGVEESVTKLLGERQGKHGMIEGTQ